MEIVIQGYSLCTNLSELYFLFGKEPDKAQKVKCCIYGRLVEGNKVECPKTLAQLFKNLNFTLFEAYKNNCIMETDGYWYHKYVGLTNKGFHSPLLSVSNLTHKNNVLLLL